MKREQLFVLLTRIGHQEQWDLAEFSGSPDNQIVYSEFWYRKRPLPLYTFTEGTLLIKKTLNNRKRWGMPVRRDDYRLFPVSLPADAAQEGQK